MNTVDPNEPQEAGSEDIELRAELGSEQKTAVDHAAYARKRKPDGELRLDGEPDTLYNDGLDIDEQGGQFAGSGNPDPKGIKG